MPTPSFDDIDGMGEYADLAEAVLRGALDCDVLDEGPHSLPVNEIQESYRVEFASWGEMVHELLIQITLDAGSIRKAARAIDMPRSTLSAKLRRHGSRS